MQVKRCDEMARKLRFFTDQVEPKFWTPGSALQSGCSWQLSEFCPQIVKASIPTGSRFGGERDLDLDTLEVRCHCLVHTEAVLLL